MTPRPTPLSIRVEGIPESLRVEHRWVGWRYVWREGKNGNPGDWTKPPYIPIAPNIEADTTDPATWGSFEDALSTYQKGRFDGIGFVLGKGYVGYDQDDNDDLSNARILNSYTELSPSGTGLHAIARGTKPGTKCRVGKEYELYDHGRYFTVTGHHIAGLPETVEERTAEIAALYARLFPNEKPSAPLSSTTPTTPQNDDALLARARAAKNGQKFAALWSGDISGYPSHSEADAALCAMLAFWTNKDAARMDRLFRRSGLIREKWDSGRGDSTYGAGVIAQAIAFTTEGYTGPRELDKAAISKRVEEVLEDLHAFCFRLSSQPPLDWHIPGLVPDEGICLWHGQPRDFKSMCALEIALALAAGRDAFKNPRFAVKRPVKVAYFTEEDPERLFAARVHWLTGKNPMPPPDAFFPFIRKGLSFDVPEDCDFIIRRLQESGAEVAIFDPTRSYTGNADKGPADLRPVAKFLRQIQNETQCKTLILVSHDTKPPASVKEGETRSRSQQASGGGIFSISDCPVSFEKLAWNQVAVYPEDYKLSGNPTPFVVTFETDERDEEDGPRFGTYVLPVAVTRDERDITESTVVRKILRFLSSTSDTWYSTDEVNKGAQLKNGAAGPVLKKLYSEDMVLFCTGDEAKAKGRKANANLWAGIEGGDVEPPMPDAPM